MRRNRLDRAVSFMKTGIPWVVLLAACSGLGTPETAPFGFLQVLTGAKNGQPASYPQATFLNAVQSGYPNSRDTTDACNVSDLAGGGLSTQESLDAGDSVAFISDHGTVYLVPTFDILGNTSYQPRVASVAITAGTEVTFQVPGRSGGFPEASLSALTPPEIDSMSPIPTSVPVTDSMVVTWAPVGDDSSRIDLSLQFGASGVPTLDRQVFCQWRDDGRGVIRGGLLTEWSHASLRKVQLTRFRTSRQVLGSGPVLYFIATYDTLPPLP
jgi:hypothetical protein